MLRNKLESMEIKDLINLMLEYDQYIMKFNEDSQGSDRKPSCLSEFLDNDYPLILKEKADKSIETQKAIILAMFRGNGK